MGWFWADSPARPRLSHAPHPIPAPGATPPPGCPMHSSDQTPSSSITADLHTTASSCPVKPSNFTQRSSQSPASAPTSDSNASSSQRSRYNPLNFMFSSISNRPESNQSIVLGLNREISSIPRGDADSNWEYPSPQQMYNAMLRKGYTDTPIDAVTSMVAVHNFLNEGAWREIATWEGIFNRGLGEGWRKCSMGEENMAIARMRAEIRGEDINGPAPKLVRFEGRPKDMTPKAAILQALGRVYPQKFQTEPPFDRHDWYVQRSTPTGPRQIRYVIDYYSGEPEPTGEPVFYLDIRPAVDTPTAAAERLIRWGGDLWYRASGASVREAEAARKAAKRIAT